MSLVVSEEVTSRTKQASSPPTHPTCRGEEHWMTSTGCSAFPGRVIYEFLRPECVKQRAAERSREQKSHRLFIWSRLSFEQWPREFLA